jgi:hypothetical protein
MSRFSDQIADVWTMDTFEQIVQLAELIDSPVFIGVRLDILAIRHHPYLFKALNALLAFLPQCPCALVLNERLQPTLLATQIATPIVRRPTIEDNLDIDELFRMYCTCNNCQI